MNNLILNLAVKRGLENIAVQRTSERRSLELAKIASVAESRKTAVIAAKEDFFLRAKARGYDMGLDPDPDGVWRSKYPKD